jgi:antitoxin component of MazEF toxin-antitoxin module
MAVDKEFNFESLLEGITPENLHDEVSLGEPVGNEAGL